MAAPSRAPGSNSVVDDVVLWAIGGVAVGAAAVWSGAQLATLVRHGEPLPVGAGTAAQAMFRLPSNAALAWPEPVRPLVPGAPLYWAATALVAVVIVAVIAAAWHLLRNQRVGTERRHRLGVDTRAHLARPADLRPLIVPGPRPGRLILGLVGSRLVATERRDPARRACRRGRQGDRSAVAVIGPTRCGKTANMISGVLEWEGPAILSSVKDDLLAATLARRADLGEVKVFDPTGTTGQPSARWSPLRGATTPTGAQKAARMLAGSTRRSGREDVEFFNDLASQLLWALLWTAAVSGRSMRDVVRWVLTRDRPTQKVRGDLAGLLDLQLAGDDTQRRLWAGDAFCALEGVWTCDPRTMSNIYVTAQRMLGVWQDPGVVAATDGCDIDLDWLVKGNNTLYVCAPLHEQARLSVLFGGLLSDLVEQQAYEWAATRRDPLPDLLVVLDEAANTPTRWLLAWPPRARASASCS